jgi:hypothetical protein
MRVLRGRIITLAIGVGLLVLGAAQPALASKQQVAFFEDDGHLLAQPDQMSSTLRSLGVGVVRVTLIWARVAPATQPAGFSPSNPGDPNYNFSAYDAVVRAAKAHGLAIDFTISSPAPVWTNAPGSPAGSNGRGQWKPSPLQYGAFVRAVGARYSGHYTPAGQSSPLPRVSFWALWNEPNFGQDLGPQATNGSRVLSSPVMYRSLLDSGYSALRATGHGRDKILIGSLAARGSRSRPTRGNPDGSPGNFGTTKPLQFIRALYCIDSRGRQLRGSAAAAESCPTSASASRRFGPRHPGLFHASGFAVHPYPVNQDPTKLYSRDRDYAELPDLPRVQSVLDGAQRAYHSRTRFPIYITEFGYITNPPNHSNHYPSPATAAVWINWAEYLMWLNPRVASTMQYLLEDPNPRVGVPEFGGFADGLEFFGGAHKPVMYDAYRMPLFLPSTRARRKHSLEVWGCVRPAAYEKHDTHATQHVAIQFQRGSRGSFKTVKTLSITDGHGYFDVKFAFPASGSVRLAWASRTVGATFFSRVQKVTVR